MPETTRNDALNNVLHLMCASCSIILKPLWHHYDTHQTAYWNHFELIMTHIKLGYILRGPRRLQAPRKASVVDRRLRLHTNTTSGEQSINDSLLLLFAPMFRVMSIGIQTDTSKCMCSRGHTPTLHDLQIKSSPTATTRWCNRCLYER
jgi:hypothetical protein